MPDPANVEGPDTFKWMAFRSTFKALEPRIRLFTSLPLASLDRMRLQQELDAIGEASASVEPAWAGRSSSR